MNLCEFDEQNQSQDILISSISHDIIRQALNHAIQEIFEEDYAFHCFEKRTLHDTKT